MAPAMLTALHEELPPPTKTGLIYFDGEANLTDPHDAKAEGSIGMLGSMVMSHYTHRINLSNIVLFAQDSNHLQVAHWTFLCENKIKCFFRPTAASNPANSTQATLSFLRERGCDMVFIHFDLMSLTVARFLWPTSHTMRGSLAR